MLANAPLQLLPGSVIFEQYEIVSLLGAGSSGLVYLCNHRELSDYPLAIKVFFNSRSEEIDVERFKREIRSAYDVNHPNVIRCYEYLYSDGLMAFTMEYMEGGNLGSRLRSEEFSEYPNIVSTIISICSGLRAIHHAGIVHRDLKPENVLLSPSGQIKIADFSISHHRSGPQLNTDGVLGTIDYISPEYMSEGAVDPRIDVYALGVIAYEMITGTIPCQGKNPYHTLKIRMEQKAEPVSLLKPDCPHILERIVMKALERDPNNRYRNANEMLHDLTRLSEIMSQKTFLKTQSLTRGIYAFDEKPLTDGRIPRVRKAGSSSIEKNKVFELMQIFGFGALTSLFGAAMSYLAMNYFF